MRTIIVSVLILLSGVSGLFAQKVPWWWESPTKLPAGNNFEYVPGMGEGRTETEARRKAEADSYRAFMMKHKGVEFSETTYKQIEQNGLAATLIGHATNYTIVCNPKAENAGRGDYKVYILYAWRIAFNKPINFDEIDASLCTDLDTVPRKTAIGICTFTGNNNNKQSEMESAIINAFSNEGRFQIGKVEDNRMGRGRTEIESPIEFDYIVSGNVTYKPPEEKYVPIPRQGSTRVVIPEYTTIAIRIESAKTGEIYVEQTINSQRIVSFVRGLFPIRCSILSIVEKQVEMVTQNGGSVYKGNVFNVYDESYRTAYGKVYTSRNKIGELKVNSINGDIIICKLTNGAKEVSTKFQSGANLIVEFSK
jgi:hypothetical protein